MDLILKIPLSNLNQVDRWSWKGTNSGSYSVKEGYKLVFNAGQMFTNDNFNWLKLWALKIPPKMKALLWRICSRTIPVASLLYQRRVQVDLQCRFCGEDIETVEHVFIQCTFGLAAL